MQEEDFDNSIKILVVGNGGVGKTSLIRRFCQGLFTENYKKTIGVDFLDKTHYVKATNEKINLMIWDTAGQEEFDTLVRMYYRGAACVVLAFSSTDRASFDALSGWRQRVLEECDDDVIMVIMQNKCDLLDQAVMTPDEVQGFAAEHKIKLYRTSVKDGMNVEEVFDYLATQYLKRRAKQTDENLAAAIGTGTGTTKNKAGGSGDQPFQIQKPVQVKGKKKRKGFKKFCTIL